MSSDAPPEAGGARTERGEPRGLLARVWGALRLDAATYAEVEDDPSALWQAALVVALGGLARGIAAFPLEGSAGLVGSTVVAFIGWTLVTLVIWLMGVRIAGNTSSFLELLRTVGFAASPLILLVIAAVPGLSQPPLFYVVQVALHAAAAVALVVATREALDVSTARALGTCALALAVLIAVTGLLVGQLLNQVLETLSNMPPGRRR